MLIGHVERFVSLRRALGHAFNEQRRTLSLFAAFAEARGEEYVTTGSICAWAGSASSPGVARMRFDTVRSFAAFMHGEDPRHEVPPAGAFGRGKRPRPAPYILTPEEITAIMAAALAVPARVAISPLTYHHLFGLLASTGLRVSEALALRCEDLTEDGLVVRRGKFGKSRLVPVHPTTRAALQRYLSNRRRIGGGSDDLFVVSHGRAPTKTRVYCVFVRIARQLGIRKPGSSGPRLHDLRHTFAVRSLEACAHDRQTVTRHMTALSTYLGHSDIANTYWYLEATTVLLNTIAAAAERAFAREAS